MRSLMIYKNKYLNQMETKPVIYKLAPKGARMNIGAPLLDLNLPKIDLYIPEEKKSRNTIKIIPSHKEKQTNTELF